jgi:hypothetical protein
MAENEEEIEDGGDDFDGEVGDVDAVDLDLEDDGDDFDDEAEERSKSDKDKYSESAVESATIANPKRLQARKKADKAIAGIISDADLSKAEGQEEAWAAIQEHIHPDHAKDYSIKVTLEETDTVSHPTFGLGLVLEELSATKVSVLFEDGIRKLVCNLG